MLLYPAHSHSYLEISRALQDLGLRDEWLELLKDAAGPALFSGRVTQIESEVLRIELFKRTGFDCAGLLSMDTHDAEKINHFLKKLTDVKSRDELQLRMSSASWQDNMGPDDINIGWCSMFATPEEVENEYKAKAKGEEVKINYKYHKDG